MWINTDELWPASDSLTALQFDSREEFNRCQMLLWEHFDSVHWLDHRSMVAFVRKDYLHLFTDAGLRYTQHEVVDEPEAMTPEEREQRRQWMRDMNTRMLHGQSLDQ
jgi:hypothetical protein